MKFLKTLGTVLITGTILTSCGGNVSESYEGYEESNGESYLENTQVQQIIPPANRENLFVPTEGTLTPLATYGPVTIYAEDFLYVISLNAINQINFLAQMGMPQELIDEHWDNEAGGGLTNRELLRQDAWQDILDRGVLTYIAFSQGFTVTDEMIEEGVRDRESFRELITSQGNDPEEVFLEMSGMSLEHFALIQPTMVLTNNFLEAFAENFEADEEFALRFFEEHREAFEYELGMQVSAVHILVDTLEEAEALLARLNAGERARDLAPLYSQDPGTAIDEGAYHFGRGEMVPEFEDWSFSANIGDTGIVQSSFGFHVMYLEGRETLHDRDHMANLMEISSEIAALEYIQYLVENSNIQFEVDYQLLASIDF